jgi:D-galacturonate reductase
LDPGSAVTIFTPDDTHYDIALYAVQRGVHVMLAKPAVMTGKQHFQLVQEAKKMGVLVCVEFHKRWINIAIDVTKTVF